GPNGERSGRDAVAEGVRICGQADPAGDYGREIRRGAGWRNACDRDGGAMRTLVAGILLAGLAHGANGPTPEFQKLEAAFADPAQGWKSLFNGKDLTGWKPQDYGKRPAKPNDW